MALAESELAPRRLAEMSPYATPQGSPMRSRRSRSRAGSISGRSAAGSVSGRSVAGSEAGSHVGSVAGSRAGSVAGSRAGSVVGTPEKELLPPAPMLGASPGMIAAQVLILDEVNVTASRMRGLDFTRRCLPPASVGVHGASICGVLSAVLYTVSSSGGYKRAESLSCRWKPGSGLRWRGQRWRTGRRRHCQAACLTHRAASGGTLAAASPSRTTLSQTASARLCEPGVRPSLGRRLSMPRHGQDIRPAVLWWRAVHQMSSCAVHKSTHPAGEPPQLAGRDVHLPYKGARSAEILVTRLCVHCKTFQQEGQCNAVRNAAHAGVAAGSQMSRSPSSSCRAIQKEIRFDRPVATRSDLTSYIR